MCHSFWIIFLLPSVILVSIGIILLMCINGTMFPYSWLGKKQSGWICKIAITLSDKFSTQLKQSGPQIVDVISNNKAVEQIRPMVEEEIEKFLREKLPVQMPMISMFIGDRTINQLKGIFVEEVEAIFPLFIEKYASENIINNPLLNDKITESIHHALLTNVPAYVNQKVFRFLLILLLTGGLIGLIQIGVMYLIV